MNTVLVIIRIAKPGMLLVRAPMSRCTCLNMTLAVLIMLG